MLFRSGRRRGLRWCCASWRRGAGCWLLHAGWRSWLVPRLVIPIGQPRQPGRLPQGACWVGCLWVRGRVGPLTPCGRSSGVVALAVPLLRPLIRGVAPSCCPVVMQAPNRFVMREIRIGVWAGRELLSRHSWRHDVFTLRLSPEAPSGTTQTPIRPACR